MPDARRKPRSNKSAGSDSLELADIQEELDRALQAAATALPTSPETTAPHPHPAPLDISPEQIKQALDDKVKGQNTPKEEPSVLIALHLSWFRTENRLHPSPNAIVIGPTGVGKTHSVRTACESLKLPFAEVDATAIVPAGILGLQVEDVLVDLVRSAGEIIKRDQRERYPDDDIALARRGIIFIDEFDKLSFAKLTGDSNANTQLVQRRLLKLVEGSRMSVGVPRHDADRSEARTIDTTGILVIVAGAFTWIDDPVFRAKRSVIQKIELTTPDEAISIDIVNYGFLPELVARLPILIQFAPLTDALLLEILNQDEISPTGVWVEYFGLRHKTIAFEDSAKRFAARRAAVLGMGARGLQQILFPRLTKLVPKIESWPEPTYHITAQDLGEQVSALKGA